MLDITELKYLSLLKLNIKKVFCFSEENSLVACILVLSLPEGI